MIASVLLLTIGVADIVRSQLSPGRRWSTRGTPLAAATATASALALLALGLGLPLPWALASALAAVVWTMLMPIQREEDAVPAPAPALWPALALLGLLSSIATFDHTTVSDRTGLIALVGPSQRALLSNVSAESVLAGLAVVVGLTQTANIVVRAVLGRNDFQDSRPDGQTAPSTASPIGRASWTLSIGGRAVGEVKAGPALPRETSPSESAMSVEPTRESSGIDTTDASGPAAERPAAERPARVTMRGGRHIGPIERILLVTAAVAGAYPVIAGLFAAKGIVRFPEIANDRPSGGKAQEFLVGSMASWLIAALAAGYLVLVSHG